jgi:hypothetical protein
MDFNTIMRMTDPNTLRARLTQIDQQVGALQSERLIVDRRFQILLSQNYKPQTSFEVKPLIDPARIRTGHEEENPLNNTGKIL